MLKDYNFCDFKPDDNDKRSAVMKALSAITLSVIDDGKIRIAHNALTIYNKLLWGWFKKGWIDHDVLSKALINYGRYIDDIVRQKRKQIQKKRVKLIPLNVAKIPKKS